MTMVLRRTLRAAAVLLVPAAMAAPFIPSAVAQESPAEPGLVQRGPRFLLAVNDGPPRPINLERTPVLRAHVGLDLSGVRLDEALETIARQAGIRLVYSGAALNLARRVSFHTDRISVAAALTEVLLDESVDILFAPSGRRAVLVKRPAEAVPATGDVVGKVTDANTGQVIQGVEVAIDGAKWKAYSDAAGRYRLTAVEVGTYVVAARRIGYGKQTRSVTVTAESPVTADFALNPSALNLDEVVVTVTGQQSRRELGNAVAVIAAPQVIEQSGSKDVFNILTGRVAGVTVTAATGTVGSTARIRVRGLTSPSPLNNEPLIYVDGVRIEASSPRWGGAQFIGGTSPSLLGIINPDEIESIEVAKGPSAATLYGTQAANGVIQITTKRGREGPARWSAFAEGGVLKDQTDYPLVYFSEGQSSTGERRRCLPSEQADGLCNIVALRTLNLLRTDSTTPFATGLQDKIGTQVSGGSGGIRYFFGAELENTRGPIQLPKSQEAFLKAERGVSEIPYDQRVPNREHKLSFRTNLGTRLGDHADLDVSMGYLQGRLRMPQTGDNDQSLLGTHLFGTADPLEPPPGPYELVPPNQLFANEVWRDSNRFTGSLRLGWRLASFLETRATIGTDYLQYDDNNEVATGQGCEVCGRTRQGTRGLNRWTNQRQSVDLGATATFHLSPRIISRTSVGAQYNRDILFGSLNTSTVFPPGGATIDFGSIRTSSEQTTKAVTLGTYVEQQIGLDDRLFLTGALRVDRNSAFGADFRNALYPKVGLSWVVRDGAETKAINSVRLRGALGVSGQPPLPNSAFTFLVPTTGTLAGGDVSGVILSGLGNPGLKPERSTELEVGADFGLLRNRVTAELTFYDKQVRDALITRSLPGSLGVSTLRFENLGRVSNIGFEAAINLVPIEGRSLRWEVGLQGSLNRNRLESLGGTPPIRGNQFQQREGYPLFGWWARPYKIDDANGDGIIVPSELVVSDTAEFMGSSVPTHSLAFRTELALGHGRFRVGGLVDYKGGHKANNQTSFYRCNFVQNCREINDPNATLEEQAKAVVEGQSAAGWIEPAWFVKFRELYVSYDIPSRWLAGLRVRTATLTLTARNLGIITNYSGWDPELTTNNVDGGYDFAQPGLPRTYVIRLNLGF